MTTRTDWLAAACRDHDTETFFPLPGPADAPTSAEQAALAVCTTCPIRAACLALALTAPHRDGVWGGHTEAQRERLLDAGRKAPDAPAPLNRSVPRTWRDTYNNLSAEVRRRILARYDAGYSAPEVAEHVGIAEHTCRRVWRAHRDGPTPAAIANRSVTAG